MRTLVSISAAVVLVTTSLSAWADPPPWAPAHGWRAKHEAHPVYALPWRSGPQPQSYGVEEGTCNRQLLGSVLGGVAGAALGSTIGKGTGKLVAVAGGAILGVLAGGTVGRGMDEVDQNCIGQALENAPNGQRIAWHNPNSSQQYTVTPVSTYKADDGQYCREYTTTAVIGGKRQQTYGHACRQPDGSWQIVN